MVVLVGRENGKRGSWFDKDFLESKWWKDHVGARKLISVFVLGG